MGSVVFCAKKIVPQTTEPFRRLSRLLPGAQIASSPSQLSAPGWSEPVCLQEPCYLSVWICGPRRPGSSSFVCCSAQVPSDPRVPCRRASLINQEQAPPWRVGYLWNPSPHLWLPEPTHKGSSPALVLRSPSGQVPGSRVGTHACALHVHQLESALVKQSPGLGQFWTDLSNVL